MQELAGPRQEVPRVEAEEVEKQLSKMARGKAADGAGIVAEMLKHGGPVLSALISDVFSDALDASREPPPFWRESRPTGFPLEMSLHPRNHIRVEPHPHSFELGVIFDDPKHHIPTHAGDFCRQLDGRPIENVRERIAVYDICERGGVCNIDPRFPYRSSHGLGFVEVLRAKHSVER